MILGEKIKKLRKQRKMTQQQFATIIGISASALGMYEQNRRIPSYKTLQKIAGRLGVPFTWFFEDDTINDSKPTNTVDLESSDDSVDSAATTNKDNSIFAVRLRAALKTNRTTMKALAEYIGISRQAVSKYCDGSTQPNADAIVKIAEFFGISADWLLGLSDCMTTNIASKELCATIGLSDNAIALLSDPDNKELRTTINHLIEQHIDYLRYTCRAADLFSEFCMDEA